MKYPKKRIALRDGDHARLGKKKFCWGHTYDFLNFIIAFSQINTKFLSILMSKKAQLQGF